MTARENTPRSTGPSAAAIRALIYDFDDTIVESERINDALFSNYLRREHAIDLSPSEQDSLYGFSWSGVFTWLKENRGLRTPKDAVWNRYLEVKREFLRGKTLRTASGFDRMLSLPVPQAIVSGSTRDELHMMLDNIHMPADAVDFILCDEDGGAGKPDPEGFLAALERFGVKPDEAMVFEDSPAGIEAAKRAGIPVAFVAELASRDNASLADMRFASFAEAWGWVRERIAPR
jgi:beta-phosphoglucomutase-like phosphatase (HAD superfamily)